MRRVPRLIVGLAIALAAVAGLAACAPFHAGAAATVGETRVSTDQLRTLTAAVLSSQPKDGTTNDVAQPVVQQRTLGELVQLQVLTALAAQEHVTVTDGAVGRARTTLTAEILQSVYGGAVPATLSPVQQQARAAGVAAAAGVDLDSLARVSAYVAALTAAQPVDPAKIIAAYDAVRDHRFYRIDVVEVSDQTTAQTVASALRGSPSTFARIAATLGAGATTMTTAPAATLEQEAGGTSLRTGSVVGPVQTSNGGYQVVLVTGVGTQTVADALAAGSSQRAAFQAQAFPVTYAATARRLGIHVNPRFGTWTPTGTDALGEQIGAVGPGGPQLSTPLSSAAPSPSASADSSTQ